MNSWPRRALLALMVCLFVGVQAAYIAAGVRFLTDGLDWFWQYLDPALLADRLWESLLYLHIQPPLFNLFLGLVLKAAPDRYAPVFWASYLGFGLALYLSTFALMRAAGVSRGVSLAASTALMASPAFVTFEHLLTYELPLALLAVLSALAFSAFLRHRRNSLALLFFFTLFLMGGIRSLFHPVYFLLAGGLLLAAAGGTRRRVLAAAVLPALLLLAIPVKNAVLFDTFGTSSWMGMSLGRMTVRAIDPAERAALVAAGELSEVATVEPYSPLSAYPDAVERPAHAPSGWERIPSLALPLKRSGGTNYNHAAYVDISRRYLQDARWTILHRPRVYLRSVAMAWFTYFRPTDEYYRTNSTYALLAPNHAALGPIVPAYDYVAYGKVPIELGRLPVAGLAGRSGVFAYLFLLLGLPAVWLFGVRVAAGRGRRVVSSEERWLIAYLCLAIGYVALVGNAFDVGENNRFRFVTDPLSLVLLALFAERVVARLRDRGTATMEREPRLEPTLTPARSS